MRGGIKDSACPVSISGFLKRSRDLRGGRWSWTLKFAHKRSWVGRWSWAEQVGPLLLRVVQVVRQQQCNGHCLCDSVQHSSWRQQLRNAQVAGQWRLGNTAGQLPLFWRRSTVSPVFFGRFSVVEPSLSRPLPTLPPSPNRPSRLRGRKATWKQSFCILYNSQGYRRDQEEEVELDPQVSPEKTMSREVELDCESWTSFASGCSSTAVQRTLSLPSTAVETAIAQCTPGRGDTALTLPLFWRRSTVSPVFSRAVSAVEPSLSSSPPPPPPPPSPRSRP